MNCFIATLGARDVNISGLAEEDIIRQVLAIPDLNEEERQIATDLVERRLRGARHLGRVLWSGIDKIKDHLSAPIIQAASLYFSYLTTTINKVILICTDQNPPHDQDTLYFGRIIRRLIIDKRWFGINNEADINMFNVQEENIHIPDVMFDFWDRQLKRRPFVSLENFERIYVQPQGGIDAVNQTLMYQLLARYKHRVVYLFKEDHVAVSRRIGFPQLFLTELEKNRIRAFIEQYHFAQAVQMLPNESNLRRFLEAAQLRMAFDFRSAFQKYEEIQGTAALSCRRYRDQVVQLIRAIDNGGVHQEILLFREVFYNMEIKWRQHEYLDVLSRLFRLYEALITREGVCVLKKNFQAASDPQPDHWRKWFEALLEKPEAQLLKEHLANNNVIYQEKNPSTFLMYEILKFYKYENFHLFDCISSLSQIRNKSIVAHGYRGVTKEEIERILDERGTNIVQLFDEIRDFIQADRANPFDGIKDTALEML